MDKVYICYIYIYMNDEISQLIFIKLSKKK